MADYREVRAELEKADILEAGAETREGRCGEIKAIEAETRDIMVERTGPTI